jgi:hypothetical protein
MGSGRGPERFMTELNDCLVRVRSAYQRSLNLGQ